MPTPAERKALLFLAGVIVLGAGVRVVRAARHDGSATTATRLALSKQLAAVDSARRDDASGAVRAPAARRRAKPRARRADDSARDARRDSTRDLSRRSQSNQALAAPATVDLDVADQSVIETLPRIGPVLARRIVDDRAANGPFGSIDGFQRVRGVGPALAAALGERVTFSGTARPSNAVVDPRLRSPPASSKSRHRERRP